VRILPQFLLHQLLIVSSEHHTWFSQDSSQLLRRSSLGLPNHLHQQDLKLHYFLQGLVISLLGRLFRCCYLLHCLLHSPLLILLTLLPFLFEFSISQPPHLLISLGVFPLPNLQVSFSQLNLHCIQPPSPCSNSQYHQGLTLYGCEEHHNVLPRELRSKIFQSMVYH